MTNRPLYQMPTPTLIVGRNVCAVLRPYFERMGYGEETATFAPTIGDARGRLETMPPPAMLIVEGQEGVVEFVCRVCKLSRDLLVMALGDDTREIRANMRLPLQVGYEKFSVAYHDLALGYAMSVGGFRGEIGKPLDRGGCEDCDNPTA